VNAKTAASPDREDRPKSALPVRIALMVLHFYKTYLSILFAGNCRFEPSCSQYAYEAIERFGVARGIWLGLKRLLRCHPLSRKFGYDPVPDNERGTTLATAENTAGTVARHSHSATIPHGVHS
jgi:uncharacterized protein